MESTIPASAKCVGERVTIQTDMSVHVCLTSVFKSCECPRRRLKKQVQDQCPNIHFPVSLT